MAKTLSATPPGAINFWRPSAFIARTPLMWGNKSFHHQVASKQMSNHLREKHYSGISIASTNRVVWVVTNAWELNEWTNVPGNALGTRLDMPVWIHCLLSNCPYLTIKAWLNEDASGWDSQLSLSFDRQLSCTLIKFELVQILMRLNERFGSFDRSWELHESRWEL